jgi:hypothetical protein
MLRRSISARPAARSAGRVRLADEPLFISGTKKEPLRLFLQLSLFFELRGFAGAFAQEVKLRTSRLIVPYYLYARYLGRMDRERALYADAERNAAYCYHLSDAAVFDGDNVAFERLNPLPRAFNDLDEYLNGVAHADFGQIGAHVFFFNSLNDVIHFADSSLSAEYPENHSGRTPGVHNRSVIQKNKDAKSGPP